MIIRSPLHYKKVISLYGSKIQTFIFGWGEDKLLDKVNLWHNGGSADFNSYLAFNKELRVGVVLLSNYSFFSNHIVDYYSAQLMKLITKKEPSQGTMIDSIGMKILEAIMRRETT